MGLFVMTQAILPALSHAGFDARSYSISLGPQLQSENGSNGTHLGQCCGCCAFWLTSLSCYCGTLDKHLLLSYSSNSCTSVLHMYCHLSSAQWCKVQRWKKWKPRNVKTLTWNPVASKQQWHWVGKKLDMSQPRKLLHLGGSVSWRSDAPCGGTSLNLQVGSCYTENSATKALSHLPYQHNKDPRSSRPALKSGLIVTSFTLQFWHPSLIGCLK